jgi:hypothetical protein
LISNVIFSALYFIYAYHSISLFIGGLGQRNNMLNQALTFFVFDGIWLACYVCDQVGRKQTAGMIDEGGFHGGWYRSDRGRRVAITCRDRKALAVRCLSL